MKILFTRRAERNYDSIRDYIRRDFGEKTAEEFVHKTDQFFNLLKSYPTMGQVEKDDIRGFQLFPQTRILYRTKGENITL